MDKARELTKVAAESQGMAELKYQAYMESSEAATKRLQNAWEGLTNSFKTSNVLAGLKKGISWVVEHLTQIVGLFGSIGLSFKTMRNTSLLFGQMRANKMGMFDLMGDKMGGRMRDAAFQLKQYATGEGEGLKGFVSRITRSTTHIDTNVAKLTTTVTGQRTASTGVTSGLTGSGQTSSDVIIGEGGGYVVRGKRVVSDLFSGKLHYQKDKGTQGRKITRADAARILQENGVATGYTLGYQQYAQAPDGTWHKIQAGGTLNKRSIDQGLRGFFGGKFNAQYLSAQQALKLQKVDVPEAITKFNVPGKKSRTASYDAETGKWRYTDTNREVKLQKALNALNEERQKNLDAIQVAEYQNSIIKQKQEEAKRVLEKAEKKQRRRQTGAQAAAVGVTAGITQGLTTGMSFKNSDGEEASKEAKLAVGGSTAMVTGVTTALLSMIPYVGPVLGPTLGPILGQAFGTYVAPLLGNLIDQQAISRRERSKEAEKIYTTLKSINSDTEKLKTLSQKSSWSYDNYQEASTVVDNISKQMFSNSKAAQALAPSILGKEVSAGLSSAALVQKLVEKFRSDYLSINATEESRKTLIEKWEKALAQEMAKQYEASQENNVYKYNEVLYNPTVKGLGAKSSIKQFITDTGAHISIDGNKVTFTDTSVEDRLLVEQQLLSYLEDQGEDKSGFYKALQKAIADLSSAIGELTDLTETINEERISAAVISSNVLNYSRAELKEKGIDVITKEVLDALNNEEIGGLYVSSSNKNYRAEWTGSYESLGETAKNYLTNYFRSSPELFGLLTKESYTLNDVLVKGLLGDLDSTEALTFLNKFSRGLGITVDKLKDYIDKYGDFTLGDLLLGDDEVFTKINSLNDILNNMVAATGLSAQNTMDIISKFPKYIKYLGDTASLVKEIASDIESWIQLQSEGFAQAIKDSTTIYDNIMAQIKEEGETLGSDFLDWLYKKENFGEVKNLGTFYDKYFSLSESDKNKYAEQFKAIDDIISKEYSSFQTNYTTKYIDIAKDYYSKLYEMQISGLEAQKSALENINSQREYENKLVEARIKLENAQNEKQMVYREGVGFVYEADQEAIQEAREELDQLETEKLTNMLQMQIDELQSQKKWLDEYAERNQFKEMAAAVEGLTKQGGPLENLNSTGQSLKEAAENILKAYKQVNNVDLHDLKGVMGAQHNDQTSLEQQNLLETGQALIKNKERLNLVNAATKGDSSALRTLLNTDSSFKSDYENAATDLDKENVLARYAGNVRDTYNSSVESFQQAYSSAESSGVATARIKLNDNFNALDLSGNIGEGGEYAKVSTENILTGKGSIPAGLVNMASEMGVKGVSEALRANGWRYRIYVATSKDGKDYPMALDTEDPDEAFKIAKRILKNRYSKEIESIEKTPYKDSRGGGAHKGDDIIREYFTMDFGYDVNPSILKKVPFGDYFYDIPSVEEFPQLRTRSVARMIFDDGDEGELETSDYVQWDSLLSYIRLLLTDGGPDVYRGLFPKETESYTGSDNIRSNSAVPYSYSIATPYAKGSLSTRAGLSTISELGPELFATPGLSGTALIPEGSKVLPADATKGLWEFGSFASEFIKPLRSLIAGFGNGDAVGFGTDESTNINTLNITLRADKDFDANKFIQQLKLLQAISKNNA